jgi:signal transduction histidine kinase
MDTGCNISEVAKRLDAAVLALGQELALTPFGGFALVTGAADEIARSGPDPIELRARFGQLEELNHDLENLIARLSHDLRSPLRSVVGTSQLLIEDYSASLPEDARDLLRRQVEAGKRMSSLIDDLVEYTRLGQGQDDRIEFDLTVMAQDVAYELAERNWPNGVRFEIEAGMRVTGYPLLARTALQALLENAVKFTTNIHHADVQVGSMRGPTERIYFVRDNGPGFSQEDAGQIFEPFTRLGGSDLPGNGIGLANARKAVIKHDGRLWAESSSGDGATFFFTLG